MQDIIQMCSFDASKSTKGASKLRRDLINTEIGHLRDLLPLPASTRQRLSQLQLMALVCVYVRKANYFQQVFKRHDLGHMPTPSIGFSKAMNGFLMMMTQNGKLLYISDNAAEYLGHSMEDLLIHGDSVYDIIDKQDHQNVQNEMSRAAVQSVNSSDDSRLFLCRMNVSRNARRQMRFGDQKVILVEGHFVSYLPLCTRNEPVLIATCTPVAMPETRECVVQGATNIFTSVHNMDMKFASIDSSGEFYLGYSRQELLNVSWYQLLHWDFMKEAQSKHRLITQSEQDRSCILLVRLQRRNGSWLWIHCVLQVREATETGQQPAIICTNQILSEREAQVMRANSWLYHYYLVQSKLQYGMTYEGQQQQQQQQTGAGNSRSSASASSPGGYYPPVMTSPVPSSSCSASGAAAVETPQPHPSSTPHQFLGLVPPPLSSPHLYPPPPAAVQHHHVYTSTLDHAASYQQQQQHFVGSNSSAAGGSHHYSGSGGHHQQGGHQQQHQQQQQQQHYHQSYPSSYHHHQSAKSEIYDRTELSGYHIKIEAKADDYPEVKEEPVATEDPMSPVSSPPRKRYRVTASTSSLPGNSVMPSNYPMSGGGLEESHHHQQRSWNEHHPHSHQHHQHHGSNVWPSNGGWINTSYPVGISQLQNQDAGNYDGGMDVSYSDDSFSPAVATAGRAVSLQQQRRLVLRHKQMVDEFPVSTNYPSTPYYVESIQRVPDTTLPPEFSPPLGYTVLTPAPTPPEDSSPGTAASCPAVEIEQLVPVTFSLRTTGQLDSAETAESLAVLQPAAGRHYLFNPTVDPSSSSHPSPPEHKPVSTTPPQ